MGSTASIRRDHLSFSLNDVYRSTGTRFRLHVQSPVLTGFEEPETVWVSSPRGSLGPGPSDARMYTLQPIEKDHYEGEAQPPYRGKVVPPPLPDRYGHFDYLKPGDQAFQCAHMFGAVRRVLDIWEMYLGGPIPWSFAFTNPRLELIPYVPWNNAHFGWGFMECGEGKDDQGVKRPFALNFDVIAHETGHGLLFSIVGLPTPGTMTTAYRGFHESASDCIALVSALHFDSFVDHVLRACKGNLYAENEMNRIGELSKSREIRDASNATKMSDVVSIDTPAKDITGKQLHALGQPLTGAVFDIMVEFYLDRLVEKNLIAADQIATIRTAVMRDEVDATDMTFVERAYAREPAGFRAALCEARDMIGYRLAESWRRLTPVGFSYEKFAVMLLDVDAGLSGARHRQMILESFEWRGISAN